MNRERRRRWQAAAFATCILTFPLCAMAQTSDVSVRVDILHGKDGSRTEAHQAGSAEAVVWLSPLSGEMSPAVPPQRTFALTQKGKQFTPHLLVIPTGSSVDFPNLDPFFHNVFSLYNGKRFDLGLYEAHTHRAVRFDREGVSYIFCNIHPQMGAIVLSLSTPFYAALVGNGPIVLHHVPSGSYRLHVWAENVPVEQLAALERDVRIDPAHADLGVLHLRASGNVMDHHENKFGKEYTQEPSQPY